MANPIPNRDKAITYHKNPRTRFGKDSSDKGVNDGIGEDRDQLEEKQEEETGETTNQVFWVAAIQQSRILIRIKKLDNDP